MQKLRTNHPLLQHLSDIRYFGSYLDRSPNSRGSLMVRDLFVNPCESYSALEAGAEREFIRNKRAVTNSGSFSHVQMSLLVPLLKSYDPSCRVVCFYHPYFLSRLEDSEPAEGHGFLCVPDELPAVMRMPGNDFSPTSFWSEDKTWFFLNDYDQACGIYGGPAALGEMLRARFPFRTFEISANSSLEDVDSEFWNSLDTLDDQVFG